VSLKKGLVDGHLLDADDPCPRLKLNDPVNKQEGVSVRQDLLDLVYVVSDHLQMVTARCPKKKEAG
jgi:hypothetical protein